ncbi:MAG: DUF6265 family protein [Sphingobacterium sp.]|nr:DUF6265 family protein [Sphingobacterium sp.]
MKTSIITWFVLLFMLCSGSIFAQAPFPSFLQGTWKVVGKENYEHWDSINDSELKGVSYGIKNGQKIVSEYLRIKKRVDKVIYSALVIGQNNGKEIDFELTYKDSTYSFTNDNHDFPNQIHYTLLTRDRMHISVEGKSGKNHAFDVEKIWKEEH